MEAWGLKLLCTEPRWQSDTLTVVKVPEGLDSQKIVDTAYAKCVRAATQPRLWPGGIA